MLTSNSNQRARTLGTLAATAGIAGMTYGASAYIGPAAVVAIGSAAEYGKTFVDIGAHAVQNYIRTTAGQYAAETFMSAVAGLGITNMLERVGRAKNGRTKTVLLATTSALALFMLGLASAPVALAGSALAVTAAHYNLPPDLAQWLETSALKAAFAAVGYSVIGASPLTSMWPLMLKGLKYAQDQAEAKMPGSGSMLVASVTSALSMMSIYCGGASASLAGLFITYAWVGVYDVKGKGKLRPLVGGMLGATAHNLALGMVAGVTAWCDDNNATYKEALEAGYGKCVETFLAVTHGMSQEMQDAQNKYLDEMRAAGEQIHKLVNRQYASGVQRTEQLASEFSAQLTAAKQLFAKGNQTSRRFHAPMGSRGMGILHGLECYQIKLIYRALGLKHPDYESEKPIKRRHLVTYLMDYLMVGIYLDPRERTQEAKSKQNEQKVSENKSDGTVAQKDVEAPTTPANPNTTENKVSEEKSSDSTEPDAGMTLESKSKTKNKVREEKSKDLRDAEDRELVKRANLQKIFGVPSDNPSYGLPEVQQFFVSWGENVLCPWLEAESQYSLEIRKTLMESSSSSPEKGSIELTPPSYPTNGNKPLGAEDAAVDTTDTQHSDPSASDSDEGIPRRGQRWEHFGFIYEKTNSWIFSVNVSKFYRNYVSPIAKKFPYERSWETDYRIFVRLMWILADSVRRFEDAQLIAVKVVKQVSPDLSKAAVWPRYGQFSWSDCADSFVFDEETRVCRRVAEEVAEGPEGGTGPAAAAKARTQQREKQAILFVRTVNVEAEKAKVEGDQTLTKEQKEVQIRKIKEEATWSAKLQAKLADMTRKAADKLHLTSALTKVLPILETCAQFISRNINYLLEQWHEMIDGCDCSPFESLDSQVRCETTWVKNALRGIWDVWTVTREMFTFTKSDGTRINIPYAMYETAKFLNANPMLVYGAVTMAEMAIKRMSEYLLDTMAVPEGPNNTGLEGYLERTNKKYRLEVEKHVNERDEIKKLMADTSTTKDDTLSERKRKNDEWLIKYPHSVQAKEELTHFLEVTLLGPPFELPSEQKKKRDGEDAVRLKAEQDLADATRKAADADTAEKNRLDQLAANAITQGTGAVAPGDVNASTWDMITKPLNAVIKFIQDTVVAMIDTVRRLLHSVWETVKEIYVIVSDLVVRMWEQIKIYSNSALEAIGFEGVITSVRAYISKKAEEGVVAVRDGAYSVSTGIVGQGGVNAAMAVAGKAADAANLVAGKLEAVAVAGGQAGMALSSFGLDVAQLTVEKQGYGQLSLLALTTLSSYYPEELERYTRKWIDSFFKTLESAGDTGAGVMTVATGGFGGLFALTGLAAWKVWILGSKVLITEFVVDSTKTLVELAKWALCCQVYVDNIYGIINMFSIDKLLAMFTKHTPRFPYVAACLRDMVLGGSWASRFGRPASVQRSLTAMGDMKRDLVWAKLHESKAFWVRAEENKTDPSVRLIPSHLILEPVAPDPMQAEGPVGRAAMNQRVLSPEEAADRVIEDRRNVTPGPVPLNTTMGQLSGRTSGSDNNSTNTYTPTASS